VRRLRTDVPNDAFRGEDVRSQYRESRCLVDPRDNTSNSAPNEIVVGAWKGMKGVGTVGSHPPSLRGTLVRRRS